VAELTQFAHSLGAAVEAEVGELPVGSSGVIVTADSSQTDPKLAERFVTATGVDLLSVSVGNIHILVDGQRDLDLERRAFIHERVKIPPGQGARHLSSLRGYPLECPKRLSDLSSNAIWQRCTAFERAGPGQLIPAVEG
jgi:hypothetical protein